MEHDLIISGGTVVDGTGGPSIKADVGVKAGRISQIGDLSGDTAAETIDATDRVVSPGFVDLHTHLDAQIGWDPMMTSTSYHGVTTALIGNCGVTFAPGSGGRHRGRRNHGWPSVGLVQLRRVSGLCTGIEACTQYCGSGGSLSRSIRSHGRSIHGRG